MSALLGLAAVLVVAGAVAVLVSAVAMLRERDALSRINVLGVATGLGLPLIMVGAFLVRLDREGFDPLGLAVLLLTLAALLIVSSVASNVLARAAYLSGAPVHPDTDPQDLARAPGVPPEETDEHP